MQARLLIPPVVLLVLCCVVPEYLRADETGPDPQTDLQSEPAIAKEMSSQLAAELDIIRDEDPDYMARAPQQDIPVPQDTPEPVETVDAELLEKANASLIVALDLLGENVATGPIDQVLYENSMRVARSVAALRDGRRCERLGPGE